MLWKIVKIDNDTQHGYAIELLNDSLRCFLFVSNSLTIHIMVGVWLLQIYTQIIIDTNKITELFKRK